MSDFERLFGGGPGAASRLPSRPDPVPPVLPVATPADPAADAANSADAARVPSGVKRAAEAGTGAPSARKPPAPTTLPNAADVVRLVGSMPNLLAPRADAPARRPVPTTIRRPIDPRPVSGAAAPAAPPTLSAVQPAPSASTAPHTLPLMSGPATLSSLRDLMTRERTVVRHYFPLRVLRRDPRYVVLLAADPGLHREVLLLIAGRGEESATGGAVSPDRNAGARSSRLSSLADDAVAIEDAFKRHAGVAGNLHHPNIVATLDAGRSDGRAFLTLERVEARPLKSLLQGDWRPTPAAALALVAALADALRHAHAQGVAHGHLSPEHLYLTEDQTLKVAGFGGWCDIGIELPPAPMLTAEAASGAGTAADAPLPDRRLHDLVALADLVERLAARAAGRRGPRTAGLVGALPESTADLLPHEIQDLIRRTRAAVAGGAASAAATGDASGADAPAPAAPPDADEWHARLTLLALRDRLAPSILGRPREPSAAALAPAAVAVEGEPGPSSFALVVPPQRPVTTKRGTALAPVGHRWGLAAVLAALALILLIGLAFLIQRPYGPPADEVAVAARPAPAVRSTAGGAATAAPQAASTASGVAAAAVPTGGAAGGAPTVVAAAPASGSDPAPVSATGSAAVAVPPLVVGAATGAAPGATGTPAARAATRRDAAAAAASAAASAASAAPAAPPSPGRLALAIVPWGEVYVDGQMKGITPPLDRLTLPPGTYAVEVRNAAGAPLQKTVTVTAGETVTLAHHF